ncbi:uncharacterized protein LOC116262017 isoform X2 [Nymphaea colorata]|uniref:uncharacterized protein LOC116262017 isoform X2 n=1 Tax=Nymphaea colorata TaxID=210225 RepID=UPI00214F5B16|nr:uncharacterized protein LOC116262017 isoform X2 [Nymphaea colorata]
MAVAATALCSALSRLTFSSAPPPSFLSSSLGTTLHFSTFRGKTRTPSFVCSDSGYNVQIVVGEAEPEEALLRRFRREVSRAGIIDECKRRRFFENKQDEKKRKAREAGRRNRRRCCFTALLLQFRDGGGPVVCVSLLVGSHFNECN